MDPTLVTVGVVALLLLLLFLEVPIGVAMGVVGFLGLTALKGGAPAFNSLASLPYTTTASYVLTVVPMFLLMGYLAFHAKLSDDAYAMANRWVNRLPGGTAIATQLGGAAFGAACGSSVAATVALGRVALPELKKQGYSTALAMGTIASAGTLAVMVPPSLWLMLYGIIVEQSIGKLFAAGLFPGLLSAVNYSILILVWVHLTKKGLKPVERYTWKERIVSLKGGLGILILAALVMGGMYTSLFGATEAAAIGAFGALVLGVARRTLSWDAFKGSLLDTAKTMSMIFLILVGANVFVQFLAAARLPIMVSEWLAIQQVPPWGFLIAIILLYGVLGCFMDTLAMMLLTLPFLFSTVLAMGFNPIWFGVIVVKLGEIGALTPPFGLTVYAAKTLAPDVPLMTVFRGAVVFILADLFTLTLIILFPQIALYLPSQMR